VRLRTCTRLSWGYSVRRTWSGPGVGRRDSGVYTERTGRMVPYAMGRQSILRSSSCRASAPTAAVGRSLAGSSRAAREENRPHGKYAQNPEASANSGAAILSTSARVVKQVPVTIRGLGYDTGPITGFLGEKTQIAIQMFELDHCYPVGPEINRRLLIWLGIRD